MSETYTFLNMCICSVTVRVCICAIQASGSIWWLLWCLEVWGKGAACVWELHDLFVVCAALLWWCSKFFLWKTLKNLSKPQSLQLHNCHFISQSNSWQRKNQHWLKHRKARSKPRIRSKREDEGRREQFRFPPLKEMKTRGAASGSLLTWFPKAKPHSTRRVWTVHRPSSCMVDQPPVAPKAAFCFFCLFF